MLLERRTVSRKTPGDGKLEISRATADAIASLRKRITTEWQGEDTYHQQILAMLRSADKEWKVTGKVLDLIPLRNRRPDPDTGDMLVTRISEGMTEWTLEDGRTGYGLSEYLDQIIDGAPVGIAE